MPTLAHLLKTLDDLFPAGGGHEAALLRQGLAEWHAELETLRAQNQDLKARRDALEAQVMHLAHEPLERVTKMLHRVMFVVEGDDEPHPAA
jgi:hypothetical protein